MDGAILAQSAYGTVDWQTVPYDYPGVKTMLGALAAYKVVRCRRQRAPLRDRTDSRLMKEPEVAGNQRPLISDENSSPMYGVGILESGIN